MRRIRVALIGLALAVPAAVALPGVVPVAASSCGTQGVAGPQVNSVQTTSGQPAFGAAGSVVVLNGNNFGNSGTVLFTGTSTAGAVVSWSNSQVQVKSPSGGLTGPLTICGNNVLALGPTTTSQQYYYPPIINPGTAAYTPASATEGKLFSINGQNFVGKPTVTMNGCGVSATVNSSSKISATVPAYQCTGSITVVDPVPGSTDGSKQQVTGPGFTVTPTIGSPSVASAHFNDSISVSGSGFGSGGTVSVGGVQANATNWSDNQVTFLAPDGTDGGAVIVDTAGGETPPSAPVAIEPELTTANPNPIDEGQTLTISGHNLGDPSKAGSVSMGSQALNVTGWSWQTVTADVPTPATSGAVTLTRADDGATATGPSVSIAPVISSVSPTSAPPGGFVTISGSGFSASPAVTIGGKPAQVAIGGDNSIAITVPSGATSGKLVVTSSYGQSVTWGQNFTVLAAGSGGSGGSGSGGFSGSGGSGSGSIYIQPNYGFLPLPKAPTPIGFHISAPSDHVRPGATVPLTVQLQLNGKPIAGSPVSLQIAESPGSDTSIAPLSGTTDANGFFHATLKTSKKAGQTVVIARSGSFGDEIRIISLAPVANTGLAPRTLITNSLDPRVLVPFVGALILAVLLLLGAVILQWRLHRRAALAVPTAPVGEVVAAPEPAAAPKRRRAPRKKPVVEAVSPAPPESLADLVADEEPPSLAPAVGAEDMTAGGIAPVIPLRARGTESAITRTRAARRAAKADPPAPSEDAAP